MLRALSSRRALLSSSSGVLSPLSISNRGLKTYLASTSSRRLAVQRHPNHGLSARSFSSYVDFYDDLDNWPRTKMNTVLNVCPQGEQMVVERLGKFDSVREGGWWLAVPVIDQITFVVDMREKALSIAPQSCITKDNVHVEVSGNLYCQFNDAQKAAYGSKNPIHAVKQHAQSSMRAAIGELELDEILHARAQLNAIVRTSVQEAAESWGLVIKRYGELELVHEYHHQPQLSLTHSYP